MIKSPCTGIVPDAFTKEKVNRTVSVLVQRLKEDEEESIYKLTPPDLSICVPSEDVYIKGMGDSLEIPIIKVTDELDQSRKVQIDNTMVQDKGSSSSGSFRESLSVTVTNSNVHLSKGTRLPTPDAETDINETK